jgi:quercetin dioxygenase-like cupin family protein
MELTVDDGGRRVLIPGEGDSVGAIGLGILVKLTGADTRGAYSVFEYVIPPELGGPPTHIHSREDELFICVAGEVTVELDGVVHVFSAGSLLLMPRGVPHMFYNAGTEEARVIAVVSPPGLERYYRDLSALPAGPRDMAKIGKIMSAHGLSLAGKGPQPPAVNDAEPVRSIAEQMVHTMCEAVDSHDFEKFGSYFTETAFYRFANNEPVRGRDAIVAATAAATGSLPTVRHRVDQIVEAGNQLFCRFTIEVETAGGVVAMPCVTVIELAGPWSGPSPEIVDYRVHMDVSPVAQAE